MKKIKFIVSCLLLMFVVCGCAKETVDTFADLSNGDRALNMSKGDYLSANEAYNYIRENKNDSISKEFLKIIMKDQIDFQDEKTLDLYNKYLNEYFKSNFVDLVDETTSKKTYWYFGEFSEKKLVNDLKNKQYDIKCGEGYTQGSLNSEYFTCDYSDYIEKEVNYEIYLKILKVNYILNERPSLIDRNEARRVNYYSIERSSNSDYTVRETLEKYVEDIEKNYNSTDESLIRSLEDVAELKRKEKLKEILENFEKISVDDSNFTQLNEYTKCGEKRCATIEEGRAYKEKEEMEKDYLVSEIVIKNNTSILYEAARNILFSDELSNYLYKIGDKNYLMSPSYGNQEVKHIYDIIMFDNSSKFYIATVDVIDSNSSFEDKVAVAELLLENISDDTIFDYCLEKTEIKIHDKEIREYFENEYMK